jgi:purine-nucleoside phosphorylase
VAVVLGSGLAAAAERTSESRSVLYASLPGFPETTVAGHPGRLMCGRLAGRKALIFCGRVHGYEGYPATEVGFGVRVAATVGVQTLIVTNVSGGVDPSLEEGEIVAISDHLNLTGASPLTGPNDERLGPRFVDMTDTYTPAVAPARLRGRPGRVRQAPARGDLRGVARAVVRDTRRGAHAAHAGRGAGGDVDDPRGDRRAALGLKVLGLSLVANLAAGREVDAAAA